MTTVAIMQPYLFPYIGYYQLVATVDIFVFLDDVHYTKRGYINRNRLVDTNQQPVSFTLPVRNASQNRPINEHYYLSDNNKLIRSIRHLYQRESQFNFHIGYIEQLLNSAANRLVSDINAQSIKQPASTLGLNTNFLNSSQVDPQPTRNGQDRILHICKNLGTSRYINLPGGRKLYDSRAFRAHGIQLSFLETQVEPIEGKNERGWHPSFLHHLLTEPRSQIRQNLAKAKISKA